MITDFWIERNLENYNQIADFFLKKQKWIKQLVNLQLKTETGKHEQTRLILLFADLRHDFVH